MRIGSQIWTWPDGGLGDKLAAIGKTGVAGVEAFVDDLKPYYASPGPLQRLLADAGVTLSGAYYGPANLMDRDAEKPVLAEVEEACRFLREMGKCFLLVNGGVPKGQPPREFSDAEFFQLARMLNRIGALAGRIGIRSVVHPHMGCTVETPADLDRLVAAGLDWSRIGLCTHAAHQYLIGADPYVIGEKYAPRVRYVHLGNADADRKGTLLAAGVLDQRRLMDPLLRAGFNGWLIVESTQDGLPQADYVADAVAYLKRTWPGLQWLD